MTKYHINRETGNTGRCNAETGRCPFGGAENHFTSEKEARDAYEKSNTDQTVISTVRKPGVRLTNRAAKHIAVKRWNELSNNPSDEELKNASAYAAVNNTYVAVGYSFDEKEGDFENLDEYDGADYLNVAKRNYLMAVPSGGFIKVGYKAGVDAQYDGAWDFSPEYNGAYEYYPDLNSLKTQQPSGKEQHISLDADEIFREELHNYNRPSYDHYSSRDTRKVALDAIKTLPKPYEIGKVAHLNHFEGKIEKELLIGKAYLSHENEAVRAAAAKRKELPAEAQEQALNDPSALVRVSLASRLDLKREHMEKLLELNDRNKDGTSDFGTTPRQIVLANPKLPVRIMSKIAKEGSIQDMHSLSRNPALGEKTAEYLNSRAKQLGVRLR